MSTLVGDDSVAGYITSLFENNYMALAKFLLSIKVTAFKIQLKN